MATYTEMHLIADGVTTTIYQKVAPGQMQIIQTQVVSYVDASDQPIELPELYEMTVVTGEALDHL